jgi:hypothetical protein
MKVFSAIIACFVGLFSFAASAQTGPLALDYSAPKGCLSEEQFRDEVAARLGSIPFAESGAPLVITIVAQNKGGFLGTLELQGRERVLRNADCPTLARDLAAALAVQLDAPPPQTGVVGGVVSSPASSDTRNTVTLDVQAEDPSLTLYVVRGQQLAYGSVGGYTAAAVGYNFESLCTAPCTLELEPNDYHFAIGRGVNTPLPLKSRVRINEPSRLDLGYKSRKAVRIVGFVLGVVGSALGVGLLVKGITSESTDMLVSGSVVAGSSLLVGTVMSMIGDRNSLELTPAH